MINLPPAALENLLEQAAMRGAEKALDAIGLGDEHAAEDIREWRALMANWRTVRKGALTQLGKMITALVIGFIMAGVAIKFHLLERGP